MAFRLPNPQPAVTPGMNFFATCVHSARSRDRHDESGVRVSSVLEGLSHALDMTEGHPRGHAVRSCLIGMRLGGAIGLDPRDRTDLLYSLLLKDAGCSSNASVVFDLFGGNDQEAKRAVWLRDWRRVPAQIAYACKYIDRGGSIAARLRKAGKLAVVGPRGTGEKIFTVRCERGARIAQMLGLSDNVAAAVRTMDEHWDGGGYPYGIRGHAAPMLGRIVGLAQVMEIFWAQGAAATRSGYRASIVDDGENRRGRRRRRRADGGPAVSQGTAARTRARDHQGRCGYAPGPGLRRRLQPGYDRADWCRRRS